MSREIWEDDEREGGGAGGLLKKIVIGIGAAAGLAVLGFAGFLLVALQGLPGLDELKRYEPPITSRVHAGDGALVAEFAEEHRLFVPIAAIPDPVRQAFVAAEDQNFFQHSGVDFVGVLRATVSNVGNMVTGKRLEGASTITQQVAKNMLLTSDRTILRKVREAFLAQRIEQALDKERILELYLNQIFLGRRAYGVAAASLNYFDKPLSDLTLGESAFLAVLPKGPNRYNPANEDGMRRALARRNYVLGRMEEQGFITAAQAAAARDEPLTIKNRMSGDQYVAAAPFVEEIRRQIVDQFDEETLLRGGLSIRSTIDTRMQLVAARAVRSGLETYDRRHGWRGPIATGNPQGDIAAQLREAPAVPSLTGWSRAMVISTEGGTRVAVEGLPRGRLVDADAQWGRTGPRDKRLQPGSIIYVSRVGETERYNLHQVPQVQGALVAMDPHTGRVLAMVGGYNLSERGLNRATQARRQPGSSFKPIVYAAALDFGLTPATLVDDGPLAIEAGDGSVWSPENYTHEFFGPTTLRRGLEMSRNAMTARVAYEMGIPRVVEYAQRLGIYDRIDPVFALALGTGETTLMRMTTAYGEFVNGGQRISPILIDRIQDRTGKSIFRVDQRECQGCNAEWRRQAAPQLPDNRERVLDPITAYQIVSMTEGVVQRGTATSLQSLGRPIGGKTGTTQDYKDAWFIGYTPDLVVGVWTGFDQPRSMGNGETGGSMAAPIFANFMREALRDTPATPFRIPAGVRLVRVDPATGLLPGVGSTSTILEAFRPNTEPQAGAMASSPFVFGGTDPIDPRVLTGMESMMTASTGGQQGGAAQPRPNAPGQPAQQPEELGGLY